jgi:hypothetical protein
MAWTALMTASADSQAAHWLVMRTAPLILRIALQNMLMVVAETLYLMIKKPVIRMIGAILPGALTLLLLLAEL